MMKIIYLLEFKEKAKVREVISTDITERQLRATVCIQKWFKNRKSIIARKATNTDGQRPNLPPPNNNNNSKINTNSNENSSISKPNINNENASATKLPNKKSKEENELSESKEQQEADNAKKKERRKRGNFFQYLM